MSILKFIKTKVEAIMMIKKNMLFLIVFAMMTAVVSYVHAASAQTCKVQVEQGWLQGAQLELVTGDGQYCAFQGVPYAAPPVGKLRFKAPQPALPWDGVRNATEPGEVCPQFDLTFAKTYLPGSEDCLFLNIYSTDTNPDEPLPVMVFIHGGFYKSGTGNQYGPDLLISHGILLVTINYRLDALGFLSMDSADVPGNAGMKDQVEAMRWIQKNIAKFGGDPDRVTIFGQSAGSGSVGFHLYSPMSKGLFKRAIMMSGSPLNEWSQSYFPERRAFALGQELGIYTDSKEELLDRLQNEPVANLVFKFPPVIALDAMFATVNKITPFSVTVEKDFGNERFLSAPIHKLIEMGNVNAVDVMVGATDKEGLIYLALFPLDSLIAPYKTYSECYVPGDLLIQNIPTQSLNLSNIIQNYYFGINQSSTLPEEYLPQFVDYLTDTAVSTWVNIFINKLTPEKYNAKRFVYTFSTVSELNIIGNEAAQYGIVGASHFDDLFYLFVMHVDIAPTIDKDSESFKLIQNSCKLWSNFAKYGNPTPDSSLGVLWLEYDNLSRAYLDIGNELKLETASNVDSLAFWQKIYVENSDLFSPPTSSSKNTSLSSSSWSSSSSSLSSSTTTSVSVSAAAASTALSALASSN